jgi:hypothetical protein
MNFAGHGRPRCVEAEESGDHRARFMSRRSASDSTTATSFSTEVRGDRCSQGNAHAGRAWFAGIFTRVSLGVDGLMTRAGVFVYHGDDCEACA